ncbi:MAG: hypothetical protein ABI691_17175 [Ginsengibacter sp.]
MEIRIEAGEPFEELQKKFCKKFPYLKIECLCNDNLIEKNQGKDLQLCNDCTIIINDNTTVADLLKQFKELLNITVQVLRRSNNLWIVTSLTDSWTLEKQNTASKHFHSS